MSTMSEQHSLVLPRDKKGKPLARIVLVNDPIKNKEFKYANNYVSTAKYSLLTFLPKNLFEQFSKVANLYFLFLAIIQLFPEVAVFPVFAELFPLSFVVLISMVKDALEDYKRHRSDRELNYKKVLVLRYKEFIKIPWSELLVGEIVKISNNDFIPADVLMLYSASENGGAYVETADLDGETNLKFKTVSMRTSFLTNEEKLSQFKATITSEPPDDNLHKFNGKVRIHNEPHSFSVSIEQLLLRGMKLRNCAYIYGVCIYCGHDTKLMMNAGGPRLKRTKLEKLTNTLIIYIFLLLLLLSLISSISRCVWEGGTGKKFLLFLSLKDKPKDSVLVVILGMFISIGLYNGLIPISLYVSVELIRLVQSWFIDSDLQLYCSETDTPGAARTTTLNEELGQVNYIFTDKTGTLTRNIMRFIKCSIKGVSYGHGETEASRAYKKRMRQEIGVAVPNIDFSDNKWADPNFLFADTILYKLVKDPSNEHVYRFFRLLALCHSVQIEWEKGNLVYAAQSPDEGALVSAARNFGFVFKSRKCGKVVIEVQGKEEEYVVLSTLEFSSERKRMSVIVRCPDNRIRLLTKGADNVILPLCVSDSQVLKETNAHLEQYATDGLRILTLAERVLAESEFNAWFERQQKATLELHDRTKYLEEINNKIEHNLELLGLTAIEDRLQEGVPDTIANLRKADLHVWVLTGDKQETAINIGFACQLLRNDQHIFVLSGNAKGRVLETIYGVQQQFEQLSEDCEKALVIDGVCLSCALEDNIKLELLEVAKACKAVICCRVTPLQKAMVVELVKENCDAITLAIGDGANDVSMIQAAHIGVGISGLEGRQAVLAADYSIAQFRFLERLLLVHGRLSYMRMSKYFFYKNFAFTLVQFWYQIYTGWSGATIYDPWHVYFSCMQQRKDIGVKGRFVTLYNIVFTSMPVMAVAVFEKDTGTKYSLANPDIYCVGQGNLLFNKAMFFNYCFLLGFFHSILLFFLPFGAAADLVLPDGKMAGFNWFSALVSASLVIVVTCTLALDILGWTVVNHCVVWISLLSWFIFGWYIYSIPAFIPNTDFFGVMHATQGTLAFWATLVLTTWTCLFPVVLYKFARLVFNPTSVDILREQNYLKKNEENSSLKNKETRCKSFCAETSIVELL